LAQLADKTAKAGRLRDNLDGTHADMMTAEKRAREAADRARQALAEARVGDQSAVPSGWYEGLGPRAGLLLLGVARLLRDGV
jgi:hypothetical protein